MHESAQQVRAYEATVQQSSEREHLILEHLPQIKYIAQRISTKLPSHVELNDLVSAGVLGLLDAIEKFDPSRGVKFKTYAELRIKGAILDSLRNLDWAPRSLRKKSKDLEKVYKELEQKLGRPATDKEVSDELGISLEEFYELVDQIKGLNLGSFQDLTSQDDDRNGSPWSNMSLTLRSWIPFSCFGSLRFETSCQEQSTPCPRRNALWFLCTTTTS